MSAQPEALRLAEVLEKAQLGLGNTASEHAATELRRLHALEADALRYRFIRDVPYSDYIHNVMTHQKNHVMDAAIDAAIAKAKVGAA
jgi:hypothetical protein